MEEPILQQPDPKLPFDVQADASDMAMAAVLLQQNPQSQLQPCVYMSKKLTDTERRWAAWEKEDPAFNPDTVLGAKEEGR